MCVYSGLDNQCALNKLSYVFTCMLMYFNWKNTIQGTLKSLYGCLSVLVPAKFFVTIHFWTTSEDILGKWGHFGHCYFKGVFEDCKTFLH